MLRNTHILSNPKVISKLFKTGSKKTVKPLTLVAMPFDKNKVLFTVSKKQIPKAVERNKIKRQIKNIFQKNNLYKDDLVFVVMVFTPFLSLSYKEASFEICKAVKS